MEFQIERAESYYAQAFAALPAEDRKNQRPGIIMAAIYELLLKEIKERWLPRHAPAREPHADAQIMDCVDDLDERVSISAINVLPSMMPKLTSIPDARSAYCRIIGAHISLQ